MIVNTLKDDKVLLYDRDLNCTQRFNINVNFAAFVTSNLVICQFEHTCAIPPRGKSRLFSQTYHYMWQSWPQFHNQVISSSCVDNHTFSAFITSVNIFCTKVSLKYVGKLPSFQLKSKIPNLSEMVAIYKNKKKWYGSKRRIGKAGILDSRKEFGAEQVHVLELFLCLSYNSLFIQVFDPACKLAIVWKEQKPRIHFD